MRLDFLSRTCTLALLVFSPGLAAFAHDDGTAATHGPIVVLITIDGFPARALKDPRLPMPTLRMLEAEGAHADAMQPINPVVTWPNHTTLITGVNAAEHHVMMNGLLVFPADGTQPQVKPWVPEAQLVHAETLYEAAAQKGMTTGQVDWVAIYGAKDVQWQFGERPDVNGPIAKDLIADHLATYDEIANFGQNSTPAWRDEIWTDAAIDILTKHTPNLLLFHLLETDTLQHMYGPLTPAAYAGYAYADTRLHRLMDAARQAGLLDRITFVIASDHGFSKYTHTISPNVALEQQNLLQMKDGAYRGKVWCKAEGGSAFIYIHDAAQKTKLLPQLQKYFASLPGVARAYTNDEARAFGIPSTSATDQAPDLYLAASPDYAFIDKVDGPIEATVAMRGQHGYLNSDSEMNALFIISGAHVRAGVDLGDISNLQVAPTIADLLDVPLTAATKPPLREALR